MSEESVEIVRRVYVALSQGDEETLRDIAVPEFVVDFSRRLVDPGVLRGRDAALAALGQIREPWDELDGLVAPETAEGRQVAAIAGHTRETLRRLVAPLRA